MECEVAPPSLKATLSDVLHRSAHTQHPEKNCTRRRNELIAKGAMNTGE